MAYGSEEEKGLSNSFLLGTTNEDCGDHQSEQQSVFQRPCMGSDLCVQVWAWATHAGWLKQARHVSPEENTTCSPF